MLGHGLGVQAPGIKEQQKAVYVMGHYQLLAHAAAVKVYREKYPQKRGGKIGIVLSTQVRERECVCVCVRARVCVCVRERKSVCG